jgi:hypothetical protein
MPAVTYDYFFPKRPEEEYLAWDGRMEEGKRLYLESPEQYEKYTSAPLKSDLVALKTSSKIVFHKRPVEIRYSVKCQAEDVATLVKKYGKKVILFQSGACPIGRKTRISKGEAITDVYIKEKQKDFAAGQPMLFGMIKEALHEHGVKAIEQRIIHDDFRDSSRREYIKNLWATLLDDKYVICVNEDDSRSYREIEQEIIIRNGNIISLCDMDHADLRIMEKEIRKMRIFSDNDGLQSVGCQAMAELGIPTVAVNMTTERGIRPLDYFTGGPLAKYKVISIVRDPAGLESQIVTEQDMDKKSRGGGISKVKHCGEAICGGVKQALVTQANYVMFDHLYQRKGTGERQFRPIDALMEGRFIGTRFVGSD